MSNAPPGKKARPAANRAHNIICADDCTSDRGLQLLCVTARAVIQISGKLDDIVTLAQQQTDLLRRLLERSAE